MPRAPRAPSWPSVLALLSIILAWMGAPALGSFAFLGRCVSVAIAIATWPLVREAWRERAQRAYADTGLAPPWASLLLVVLFLGLLFPLWTGEPPVSRDHAMHYFQTARFVDAWRGAHPVFDGLAGWSDQLNAGYPYGDSYPLLGYALTSALHLLSFGAIGLRASYALGLVMMWALMVWSIRALAIRALSEIRERRAPREGAAARNDPYAWAGAIAAACFLLDPGASREGGWIYCMFHGVWPQLLGTAAWLASLELSLRAFEDARPRRIALATLALGAALMAHPFAWPCAAMSGLALGVSALECSGRRKGVLVVWLTIHLGALALAAGSILRFFVSARTLTRGPVLWSELPELLRELVVGPGFSTPLTVVSTGALVGAWLMVRRACSGASEARPRFVSLWAALVALLFSCACLESLTVLRLHLLLPGLKNLQYPRFAIALRPLWSIAAGVGMVWGLGALRQRADSRARGEGLVGSARVVAAVLAAPFIVAALGALGRGPSAPVGQAQVLWKHHDRAAEAELTQQLRQESLVTKGPLAVAFLRRGMGPRTYPIFSITDAGARLIVDEHIPAVNFRHQLEGRSLASLHAMGATHVVFDRALDPKRDALLGDKLETVWSKGGWTLARIEDAQPRSRPWSKVEDNRGVSATLSPVRGGYDIEVEGAVRPFDMVAAIAPHFRWSLRPAGGKEQLVVTHARPSPGLDGIRMTLPAKGHYELRRHELQVEVHARILSWFALVLAAVALAGGRSREFPLRAAPPRAFAHRGRALGGLGLLLLVLGVGRQESRLQSNWADAWTDSFTRAAPATSTPPRFEPLLSPEQVMVSKPTRPACSALHLRDPRLGCSRAGQRERLSVLYRHPHLFRCVSIHLEPRETRSVDIDAGAPVDLLLLAASEANQGGLEIVERSTRRVLDLRPNNPKPFRLEGTQGKATLTLTNKTNEERRPCLAVTALHP